ncbi:type VII secretion protein EccCa [Corynebacterium cystitidis]|uniref:type VII secretion protein EccCa n=1 Tax=Corynebacterium cystitidis TaxID=35757 RepID=UPI00211ED4A3|nr:type VII secretion protein EccCa [Corynebacterium cystitidis]
MLGVHQDFVVAPISPAQKQTGPALPQGTLKAEPVPEAQRPTPEPLMRIIIPIVMIGALLSIVLIMALSGRGMSPMMLLFPLMMGMSMLMMVSPPEKTGDIDEQRRIYLRHLDALSAQARDHAQQQRDHELFHHPHPAKLLTTVDPARTWERGQQDPRVGEVRVGLGVGSLTTPIDVDDPGSTEDLDPVCAVSLRRAVAAVSSVHGIPIVVQIQAFRLITLSGPGAWSTASSMLAQLLFFHGPETVGITNRCSQGMADWLKWTTHTRSPEEAELHITVVDVESPHLSHTVVQTESSTSENRDSSRCTFVIAPDPQDPIHRFADDEGIHVHIDDHVSVFTMVGEERLGTPDDFSIADAELVARRLAPLRRPEAGEGSGANNELMDLLRMPAIDQISPRALWPGRDLAPNRLKVPIGIDEHGMPVQLDLKESAHGGMGPHGLCIGATGSGKSELLRTLVVALATTHSPDELNFVLVDFKGGATFLGCEDLPHTSAVITNLDNEAILVERMYDAISGELNRRQELLRHAGNFANVTDYTTARLSNRPDLAPLPALVIVVDEFSELLGQHPDFADLFVAVGRLGRSLGVHLLLASQRLEEGKLRGLDSHLSYRIGLKTFSASESRQVLGVSDAYQLPSSPGAGYIRADSAELTRFQAAYVSGPLARRETPKEGINRIAVQEYTGWDQLTAAPDTPVTFDDSTTLLHAVVELARTAATGREQRAHQVWLPPLPAAIELSHVAGNTRRGERSPSVPGQLRAPIGIVDLPYHQRQDTLMVDLTRAGGHFAIAGGPQTGKSTALRTIVSSLALTTGTDDLAFYIIDAGSGDYQDLHRLPHVAGIATRHEPEKLRRIVDEVAGFLDEPAGRHVVLVIDGWHALIGPDQEFDDLRTALARLASDGPAARIHLVLSVQRWTSLRSSIRDLIGNKIELRLGEALDSQIGRKQQQKLPAAPGRGLDADGRMMLVAQTAKQDVAHIVAEAKRAGLLPVPQLRTLPAHIEWDSIQGDNAAPVIGIGGPDLAALTLHGHHFFVTGLAESGKSTALLTLMRWVETQPRDAARLVVIDPRRAHLGQLNEDMVAMYAATTEAAAKACSQATATLRARLPGPDVTAEQLATRSWWTGPDIYIVIDDLDLVPDEHLRPLLELLPHSADIGMHIFVARKFGGVGRALHGRFLAALKDEQPTVVVLDGNREEGAVFGVRASAQPPGRGTLVAEDAIVGMVQIASTVAPPQAAGEDSK